jgi:hypothetical protein
LTTEIAHCLLNADSKGDSADENRFV